MSVSWYCWWANGRREVAQETQRDLAFHGRLLGLAAEQRDAILHVLVPRSNNEIEDDVTLLAVRREDESPLRRIAFRPRPTRQA